MADNKRITRAWRIWGIEGHRQRESFVPSYRYDGIQREDGTVDIEVINGDKTGTNDYSIIRITADSAEACEKELIGQVSDGVYENSRTGKIEEIAADAL